MNPNNNDDLMRTVQDLLARVRHLEDTLEIQQLQSKYIHYLFKQRFDRIVDECFAHNLARRVRRVLR